MQFYFPKLQIFNKKNPEIICNISAPPLFFLFMYVWMENNLLLGDLSFKAKEGINGRGDK